MPLPVRVAAVPGLRRHPEHLRELREICRQQGVALFAVLRAKAQREMASGNGFSA
jgi:hypothetical protein